MIFGLFGIFGVYNFGCEAIVRGAYSFIKDLDINNRIMYFSYSYEFDKRALEDLDIEIIKVKDSSSVVKKGINKLYRTFGIEKQLLMFDYKSILEKVDVILSIGGDIYTIPQIYREKTRYHYYNQLIDFCNRARELDKKVIVYGASVGPWGNYEKAVRYYSNNMQKYNMIICRENESIQYLKNLGFENVYFMPDPAFKLKKGDYCHGEFIGINISPLSLEEIYGNVTEENIVKFADFIDEMIERKGKSVMFLPHVISNDVRDNDLLFMKSIREKTRNKDRIIIADSNSGFLGIKSDIKKCYIVISARMHCAINAIEENIPTIFLSYSTKSIGMCKYVYGEDRWCVKINDLNLKLLDIIDDLENEYDLIVEQLISRNNEIEKEYYSCFKNIKSF